MSSIAIYVAFAMIHNMTSWNVMSPMIIICLNLLQKTSLSLAERENTSTPKCDPSLGQIVRFTLKCFISLHKTSQLFFWVKFSESYLARHSLHGSHKEEELFCGEAELVLTLRWRN